MSDTITQPTIRVRIAHTNTIKEGWRLSETTVEWTGQSNPNWDDIAEQMELAHSHGSREAFQRNNALEESL